MRQNNLIGFILVAVALTLLMPCTGFVQERPLIISFRGDAVTMDPHGRSESTNVTILDHIFSKLVEISPKGEILADLAKSWKNINDFTWEFYLHKGLKFTNGEPVNATAVKYSIERALKHPKSNFAYSVPNYKELIAVDETTFRMILNNPNPEVLYMLYNLNIVPPKYYQTHDDTYLATHPVGAGPYKFVKWVKDEYLEMERNEDWLLEKPDFKRVIFRPIPEDMTRVAALLSGEIDVCAAVPIVDIPRIEKYEKTYIIRCPSGRVMYVMFDVYTDMGGPTPKMQPGIPAGKANPFKDISVRKAIAHAINVNEIINQVMEGSAYPATQLIRPEVDGYNPDIKQPKFDRELAKKLLKEAGYEKGFVANFDAPNDRYINDRLVAEAIAGQLEGIGIKLDVIAQPKSVFFTKIDKYESPMFLAGWVNPSFEATYDKYVRVQTKQHGRNNRGRLIDHELDRMLDEANSTLDDKLRTKRRQACSMRIYNHYYILPLYFEEIVTGISRRVQTNVCHINERIHAWDFKKAK